MANRLLLHERHVAAGARFVTVGDWDLPADYRDASAEYAAARRGVALADRGNWGVLDVTGRDRATFLHALLSNEIKALQPGQGCTAALLDVHGKVQVILTVWVLEDRIRLVMPRGLTAKISQALDHYLFSEKASFTDASDETALLMLLGPEAPATIERLTGVRPPARESLDRGGRLGTQEHQERGLVGRVRERRLLGEEIVVERLGDLGSQPPRHDEPDAILEHPDGQDDLDLAVDVEQRRGAPLPRLERLDLVREERVEKRGAVAPGDVEDSPVPPIRGRPAPARGGVLG